MTNLLTNCRWREPARNEMVIHVLGEDEKKISGLPLKKNLFS